MWLTDEERFSTPLSPLCCGLRFGFYGLSTGDKLIIRAADLRGMVVHGPHATLGEYAVAFARAVVLCPSLAFAVDTSSELID